MAASQKSWSKGLHHIVKVHMHNFMTYRDELVEPGPRLNLLLGPNGSGKSSLVCAIAIALGGRLKLLGRGKAYGQYVRHAHGSSDKTGYVKVWLRWDRPPSQVDTWSVECHMDARRPEFSEYRLNEEKKHVKVVRQELQRHFGINLENLSSFMPQDKVKSFSTLTGSQLLESTLEVVKPEVCGVDSSDEEDEEEGGDEEVGGQAGAAAAGAAAGAAAAAQALSRPMSGNLLRLWREISAAGEQEKRQLQAIDNLEEEVTGLTSKVARLREKAKTLEERQQLEEKSELLQKQRAWVLVETCGPQIRQAKATRDAAAAELEEARHKLAVRRDEAERARASRDQARQAVSAAQRRRAGMEDQATSLRKAAEKLAEAMRARAQELATAQSKLQTLREGLGALEAALGDAEDNLAGARPLEEMNAKIDALAPARSAARRELHRLESKRREMYDAVGDVRKELESSRSELRSVASVTQKRMNALLKQVQDAGAMLTWLQRPETRDSFKHAVLGPIAVEVNQRPKFPFALQALENHLSKEVMGAFVTRCDADFRRARAYVEQHRLAVTIHNTRTAEGGAEAGQPVRHYPRSAWDGRHAQLLVSHLDDALTTRPEAAECIVALRQLGGIGNVLLRKEEGEEEDGFAPTQLASELVAKSGKNVVLISPTTYTIVRRSLYNEAITSDSSRALRPAIVFGPQDTAQEEKLRGACAELEGQLSGLQAQLAAATEAAQEARVAMRRLEEQHNVLRVERTRVKQLQQMVEEKQGEVEERRRAIADVEAQLQDAERGRQELRRLAARRVGALRKYVEHVSAAEDATRAWDGARILCDAEELALKIASRDAATAEATASAKEGLHKEAAEAVDGLKVRKRRLLRQACREHPLWSCGRAPAGGSFPGQCFCGEAADVRDDRELWFARDPDMSRSLAGDPRRAACAKPIGSEAREAVLTFFEEHADELGEEGGYERLAAALQEELNETERKMRMIVDDPGLREALANAEMQLEAKQSTLAEMRGRVDSQFKELRARRAVFDKGVHDMVKLMSREFSRTFRSVGEQGKVELDTANGDYKKYAIEIKVAFRSGQPLCKLDQNIHSGGEKAVSTMLYLLAMQKVAKTVPFRVVDEINQGMDELNERRVFDHIVDSSCTAGSDEPQYFVVTPKLLPGLHYRSGVTVLLVLNGPRNSLSMPTGWNVRAMIDEVREERGLPRIDWVVHDARCARARKRGRPAAAGAAPPAKKGSAAADAEAGAAAGPDRRSHR